MLQYRFTPISINVPLPPVTHVPSKYLNSQIIPKGAAPPNVIISSSKFQSLQLSITTIDEMNTCDKTTLAPGFSDDIYAQDRDGDLKAAHLGRGNRNAFDFLNAPYMFSHPRDRTDSVEVPAPQSPHN